MIKIKIATLLTGMVFLGASCNLLTDTLGFTSGVKGVFRSDDAGKSFRPINKAAKDDLASVSVNTLVFDPQNRETIYLGSSSGIHRTENSGDEWRHILAGIAVSDIAIDPYKNELIYAVGLSSGKGKIIRTTDKGSSWTDIYTEPTSSVTVTSLVVGRTSPWLLVASLSTGEIIRSTDEGISWQAATDLQDRIVKLAAGPGSNIYALTKTRGVFKSTDNGNTWQHLSANLTTTSFTNFSAQAAAVTEFHDMVLDQRQSGVIYLGTEQGLVRTVNDGANWSFLNMPVKNTLLRVSAAAVNPSNSNNLFAIVGSTMFKSLNGGVTWETRELPTGQEVRQILINPESTNVVYLGLGNRK
jgi:photosystem II stability/assembly factor-like uncharacterized protein